MIVALAGFESPAPNSLVPANHLPFSSRALDTGTPWTIRIAKVFGDPINLEIVAALNEATMSATELQAKIGGASRSTFDRKCKVLADLGWIVQVEKKTDGMRRGSQAIFYRATLPAVWPDEAWGCIPESVRVGESWEIYRSLCERVFKAVVHGTFNRRIERHLTWNSLLVDETGWQQVIAKMNSAQRSLSEVERLANRRLGAKNMGLDATCFLGAFESPPLGVPPTWGDLAAAAERA